MKGELSSLVERMTMAVDFLWPVSWGHFFEGHTLVQKTVNTYKINLPGRVST